MRSGIRDRTKFYCTSSGLDTSTREGRSFHARTLFSRPSVLGGLRHTTDDTEKQTQPSKLPNAKEDGLVASRRLPDRLCFSRGGVVFVRVCFSQDRQSWRGVLGYTTDETENLMQPSKLPPIKRQSGWTGCKPLSSRPSVFLSRGEVFVRVCFSQDRQSWGESWAHYY